MASGEKTKARDIIAAIRTLKAIEQERRLATPDEKHILARFSGFGPVALTSLRDQLKAGLSSSAHQADKEEGPSVSELAEKIKALKATHSIEGTPQRVRQKHSSAEEPVTARIRRRAESLPVSDPAMEAEAVLPQEPSQNLAAKPPMTFQERIALERQRKDDGQSPP